MSLLNQRSTNSVMVQFNDISFILLHCITYWFWLSLAWWHSIDMVYNCYDIKYRFDFVQPAFDIHPPNLKHQVHDLQEFIFQLVVLNFSITLFWMMLPCLSDNQPYKSRDVWGKSGKILVILVLKLWLPLVDFSNSVHFKSWFCNSKISLYIKGLKL